MTTRETYWLPFWKSTRLTIVTVVSSLVLCLVLVKAVGSTTFEERLKPLDLLNIIPFEDDDPNAGWDRGSEVAPAAHLAAEQINNRTDLLHGYRLRVLDVDSEGCGLSVITKGLVNMYRHLVDPKLNVVGVMGLLCSTVTNVLAPVVDHPEIDYVTVAGSTTHHHHNQDKFPRLFHTISPSIIYNGALAKLKNEFGWSKISLVYDSLGVKFISIAIDLIEKYRKILNTVVPITPVRVKETMDVLKQAESRVIYCSVTGVEAARLLCETYRRGLSYPSYVFIFLRATSTEILGNVNYTSCSEKELIYSINGTLLFGYKLQFEANLRLYSEITYGEYVSHLPNGSNTSEFANVVYDQVWAFALALNSSLETLNGSLATYSFGDRHITDVIAENLERVDFQGAAGRVKFNKNRETGTLVEIFQMWNGRENLVAIYSPHDSTITFTEIGKHLQNTIPKDHFDSVYVTIPLWLALVVFLVAALVILLITVILISLLILRNSPKIKASSPYLSLCVLVGCYMLSIATVIRTTQGSFFITNEAFFIFTCYSDSLLGSTGLLLIYGTLLLRMIRVYRVFTYFGKTGKIWQDPFLFLYIMAMCSINVIIFITWISFDNIQREETIEYIKVSPEPYYQTSFSCTCQHYSLWIVLTVAFPGIIMLVVVFFAVRTRHIKRNYFKDTKKVNAFIFLTLVIFPLLLALWRIFSFTKLSVLSHISLSTAFLGIAALCQVFIFIPKLYHESKTKHQSF